MENTAPRKFKSSLLLPARVAQPLEPLLEHRDDDPLVQHTPSTEVVLRARARAKEEANVTTRLRADLRRASDDNARLAGELSAVHHAKEVLRRSNDELAARCRALQTE